MMIHTVSGRNDTSPSANSGQGKGAAGPYPPAALDHDGQQLYGCLRVLATLFKFYGFAGDLDRPVEKSLKHWITLARELGPVSWMKVAKYKIAAFFSSWLGFELPPRPAKTTAWETDNPSILLGGAPSRWCRSFLGRGTKTWSLEQLSFLTSVLYSKKGMPRPGDYELIRALIDTAMKLTTLPPTQMEDRNPAHPNLILQGVSDWSGGFGAEAIEDERLYSWQWQELNRNSVEYQLRRTVREAFRGKVMKTEDYLRPFVPSTSGNYIASRQNGGAIGAIMEHQELLMGADSSFLDFDLPDTDPLFQEWSELRSAFQLLVSPSPAAPVRCTFNLGATLANDEGDLGNNTGYPELVVDP